MDDKMGLYLKDSNPSLTMPDEQNQNDVKLVSNLLNWGATFAEAFVEPMGEGILEPLQELAATRGESAGREGFEEDVAVAEQAQTFVKNIEKCSTMALCVMNELLLRRIEGDKMLEA